MCGIAGYWSPPKGPHPANHQTGLAMAARIAHRGPDADGAWADADAGVVLAHRRLSVIELSEAGAQPMDSPSGRFIVVFNGEIYNHQDLRRDLETRGAAPDWQGGSDTETLLAAIEDMGVDATLRAACGMFAFALWDRKLRRLTLARDRMGEKPLYYGISGGVLMFASEPAALKAHPAFDSTLNMDAMHLYLRFCYIPAPQSIYRDIAKLGPGQTVTFVGVDPTNPPAPQVYWSVEEDAVASGRARPFTGDFEAATDQLDALLTKAVQQQMLSDVPLGAFLSGGIDSSTIVALMQNISARPVQTFTIGTNSEAFNEAHHAKEVAAHLGTDHTELYISPSEALEAVPKMATMYSEPFSDSSQIPTYLVSRLARGSVTVALSGDGGDELFAGYNRYLQIDRFLKTKRLPQPVRHLAAAGLQAVSPETLNRRLAGIRHRLPGGLSAGNLGDRLHKAAGVLAAPDAAAYYRTLSSTWQNPAQILRQGVEPETALAHRPITGSSRDGMIEDMMRLDLLTYLPGDILCKVDRAAMAVSLETRVPMLDPDVIRFAWSLPLSYKLEAGEGKRVLREVLYRYVPKRLIERPKMGFGIPLDQWLRGPLRDWAEALLDPGRMKEEGIFDPVPIRKIWAQHLKGSHNHQYLIWSILMFQSWKAEAV